MASGSVSPEIRASSGDWFEIRDQLVRAILKDLQITLSAPEQTNLFKRGTTSKVALEWMIKSGSVYYQLAGYDKVEAMARKALEVDPRYDEAKVILAAALGSQGKSDEALATIRPVLESHPKYFQGRLVLGTIYMLQEKFPEAEDELRAVLREDPEDGEACERLGEIYHAQDWLTRAVIYLQKARDLNPYEVSARAHLGALYAIQGKRDLAMAELREAEHYTVPDAGLGNGEQMFCLAYESLNDIPQALKHYDKFLSLARKLAVNPELVKSFEERYLKLKATMTPQAVTAKSPKSFSEESLLQLVRQNLTADEFRYITNPIASTPEMRQWARQLTHGATNQLQKAKMLFDTLMLHLDPDPGGTRTAREVYENWNKPGLSFHCQEYARLFVALGRAVGLETFYTKIEKDFNSNIVHHSCAAVRIDDKFLLVDPTYAWFGVPHFKFEIQDDFEALVGWLSQVEDLRLRRIGAKLLPDSFQANVDLFLGLANEKQWDEARVLLKKIVSMQPDHWLTQCAQARLAYRENRLDEAIDLLQKSLKENPIIHNTRLFLAEVLQEQKKWREARDELRAALRCKISEEDADFARRGIALINEKIGSD